MAFLFFTGNLFTGFNLTLWFIAMGLFIWSLWLRDPDSDSLWKRLRTFLARGKWEITINRWTLLLLAAALIVIFFRVYHIQQTPAEPFSDHAEKLLDVYDVSQGQTHIFFPRNTGREAIQMYWTLLDVLDFWDRTIVLEPEDRDGPDWAFSHCRIYICLARNWRVRASACWRFSGGHRLLA